MSAFRLVASNALTFLKLFARRQTDLSLVLKGYCIEGRITLRKPAVSGSGALCQWAYVIAFPSHKTFILLTSVILVILYCFCGWAFASPVQR